MRRLTGQKDLDQHGRCSKVQGSSWSWALAWHSPGQGERSVVPIDIVFETRWGGKTTPVTPVTPPKHSICLQARLPSTNTVAASSNHLPCRGPRAPAGCRNSLSMPWAKIQMQQIQILHGPPLGI